jgi:hypothetical protein
VPPNQVLSRPDPDVVMMLEHPQWEFTDPRFNQSYQALKLRIENELPVCWWVDWRGPGGWWRGWGWG